MAYHYVYNESGKLIAEQVEISTASGVLSREMEHGYDAYGRNTSFKVKQGDVVEQSLSYTYNTAGQVSSITADGKEFTYSYVQNAPQLIAGVISPIHSVTNVYEEKRDILESKTNSWKNKADKGVISSYSYIVNNLGQRVSVETAGEAFGATPAPWAWNYDVLGQVIKANNNSYVYDSIGNRKTSGKDDSILANYTSNNLNQYTAVNANTPTYDNEGNLLSGLSKTTSLPSRDMLSFVYNADNRPIKVSQNGEVIEEYEYDPMGRRIRVGNTIILYNGYNAVAEYDSSSHQLKTSYTWGLDLSGSTQGAGGVGGLLSVTDHTTQTPLTSYPTYDGNGNISEYLTEQSSSASSGNSSLGNQELGLITAHYEYDAFGSVIKKTGDKNYTYQFSTKPFDAITGLNYYNYRLYDPASGRWINRDPIYEQGGFNLYNFIQNNSVDDWDYLGFYGSSITVSVAQQWYDDEGRTGKGPNSDDSYLFTLKGVASAQCTEDDGVLQITNTTKDSATASSYGILNLVSLKKASGDMMPEVRDVQKSSGSVLFTTKVAVDNSVWNSVVIGSAVGVVTGGAAIGVGVVVGGSVALGGALTGGGLGVASALLPAALTEEKVTIYSIGVNFSCNCDKETGKYKIKAEWGEGSPKWALDRPSSHRNGPGGYEAYINEMWLSPSK